MPNDARMAALQYDSQLGASDPAQRKRRGAWYTPQPIIRFIVRAIHHLLQEELGIPDGLVAREHSLRILDPATGTGLFLAGIIRHLRDEWSEPATWPDYARTTLAARLHGVEVMEEALGLARQYLAAELGCEPNLLHTNALAGEPLLPTHEGDPGPLVILGNPPYNNGATPENSTPWIEALLAPYKREPDSPSKLRERKLNLNDDYVRFIRMAEHLVTVHGRGIVALVTPHGFLSNPTFRGMRWHLLRTFARIYTLDLHGNTRRGETNAGGDQNPFPIQQGVAITLFVRNGNEQGLGQLFHHEIRGSRLSKFEWLQTHALPDIAWQGLTPAAPYYLFVPRDASHAAEYLRGFALDELFTLRSIGVETSQDALLTASTPTQLEATISDLIRLPEEALRTRYRIRESPNWSIERAKKELNNSCNPAQILPYTYRPFETRYIYYSPRSHGLLSRPHHTTSQHLLGGDNLLLIVQKESAQGDFSNVFCSRHLTDRHAIGATSYLLPLFTLTSSDSLAPNLELELLQAIQDHLKEPLEPLALFDFIYATLHCPTYRAHFREELRLGFPRIPYPTGDEQFRRLAALGSRLRGLHLLAGCEAWEPQVELLGEGDCTVATPRWADAEGGRVYINRTRYFAPLPRPVWEFRIGAFQPLQLWLGARKRQLLTDAAIAHYRRMAHAIAQTIATMADIDSAWTDRGNAPLASSQ